MSKIGIFMISCIGIAAIPGCAAESPTADIEQTQTDESEITAEGGATNVIGAFHLIRLSNTHLCLQPRGGSTGDVPVELHQCTSSAPAQNWLFVSQTGGREVVNQQSGKCLYNNSAVNGGSVTHGDCNVFGTSSPASNALWKPSSLTNFSTLQSEIGRRDSGFCLDVPGGNAFDGAIVTIFRCNGTPAQTWVVGVE